MGLLDALQPQQQQGGGLLGGIPQQEAPQAGGDGMQMLQQLMQNPTPEAAQGMAQQLQQKGPEGAQMAQMLMGVANDPEGIKKFAAAVMQQIGGQ
jgi:hypothetical protein